MPRTTTQRRWVSIADAAEYAACNPKTIRRRISDGTITGYRLGRVIRVDLNEVDEKLLRPIPTRARGTAA